MPQFIFLMAFMRQQIMLPTLSYHDSLERTNRQKKCSEFSDTPVEESVSRFSLHVCESHEFISPVTPPPHSVQP